MTLSAATASSLDPALVARIPYAFARTHGVLAYAVYKKDPVFILGQGAGLFVYLRNLYLIRRKRRQLAQAGA